MHTQLDVRTSIPVFGFITEAAGHDVNAMVSLNYEPESFYIFDRGYLDFKRLYIIHSRETIFLIRVKKSLKFKRQYSKKVDKSTGVRYDQEEVCWKAFIQLRNIP